MGHLQKKNGILSKKIPYWGGGGGGLPTGEFFLHNTVFISEGVPKCSLNCLHRTARAVWEILTDHKTNQTNWFFLAILAIMIDMINMNLLKLQLEWKRGEFADRYIFFLSVFTEFPINIFFLAVFTEFPIIESDYISILPFRLVRHPTILKKVISSNITFQLL